MAPRATLFLTLTTLLIFFAHPARPAPPLTLQAPASAASEGYLTFRWPMVDTGFTLDAPPALEGQLALQLAHSPAFDAIAFRYPLYEQAQATVSGLPDGTYFARLVSDVQGPVSNVVEFRVQHRDLGHAGLLFSLGALLFALLIVTLLRLNHNNHARNAR